MYKIGLEISRTYALDWIPIMGLKNSNEAYKL